MTRHFPLFKSLELERCETYASHTLAHVYLMQGMHDKGIEFMLSTENDWNVRVIFLQLTFFSQEHLSKVKIIPHTHILSATQLTIATRLTINTCFKT